MTENGFFPTRLFGIREEWENRNNNHVPDSYGQEWVREITLALSIGNHMISSAIWDKSARLNFSKTNKIARARRASAICSR